MLAELTDGNSRAQLLTLLGADSIETLRTRANAVWNASYCDDGATKSVLVSSLWLDETISFTPETMNRLASNYYASSYSGKPGSAEFDQALRSWLNAQTGGMLTDRIDTIKTDANTVLALAATISF